MENVNKKPDKETYEVWRKDPANWKWGFLYYNPQDKRIFPPKISGLEWTVNFANRKSILAFVVVLIILFAGMYIWYRIDNPK